MNGDRLHCNRAARGGAAATLALLVVLAVAPALACTGNRGNLNATPPRADAGNVIEVTGTQFMPAPAPDVALRWGGPSAAVIMAVAPDENGSFSARMAVPAAAQPGFHQITAVQPGADPPYTATFAVEVRGAPQTPVTRPESAPATATAPTTSPAAAPAPASAAQPAPAAQLPAPRAATTRRPATAVAGPVQAVAGAPAAPAAPSPAPAAVPPVPAPAAVPPAPSGNRTPEATAPAAVVEPIPALPVREPGAMGRPRTETIDSGAPPWLVPLVVVGLALAVASCAAVVSDGRQRHVRAEAEATTRSP